MDVVVTVPKSFGWQKWLDEGDCAGDPETGNLSWFLVSRRPAKIEIGDRVYVVYNGTLRGYAPIVGTPSTVDHRNEVKHYLLRKGGAVAVTIPDSCPGFRGFRYRWWDRNEEIPFPDWKNPNACLRRPEDCP